MEDLDEKSLVIDTLQMSYTGTQKLMPRPLPLIHDDDTPPETL